jgi:hypothetical protein
MLFSLLVIAVLASLASIVFVFLGDAGSRRLASGDWDRQWREDAQAPRESWKRSKWDVLLE